MRTYHNLWPSSRMIPALSSVTGTNYLREGGSTPQFPAEATSLDLASLSLRLATWHASAFKGLEIASECHNSSPAFFGPPGESPSRTGNISGILLRVPIRIIKGKAAGDHLQERATHRLVGSPRNVYCAPELLPPQRITGLTLPLITGEPDSLSVCSIALGEPHLPSSRLFTPSLTSSNSSIPWNSLHCSIPTTENISHCANAPNMNETDKSTFVGASGTG